jgi:5-methylcytosine-specific restriction endonuclease McrA
VSQYKVCHGCRIGKSYNSFTKDKTRSDGYQERCKPCRAKKTAEWKKNNPEYIKTWLRENPKYIVAWRAKRFWYMGHRLAKTRAKNLGCDVFKILDKNFYSLFRNRCFVCGSDDDKTMDHIIPLHRGGTHGIGNLQILCKSCNSRKGKKTMMEWKMSELRD